MNKAQQKQDDSPTAPSRLEDLARLAGVSVATVSRALNDSHLVSEKTKQRILSLADRHHYAGRTQFTPRAATEPSALSVIIPPLQGRDIHLSNPFLMELIGGIGDALWEWSENLVVAHYNEDLHGQLRAGGRNQNPSAFIALGQGLLHDELNRMAERGVPVVVWGERMDNQRYCVLGSDNEAGGYRATNHLLRLGRKRIAFIGDDKSGESALRFKGYRKALDEAGADFDPRLIQPTTLYPEAGYETLESMLTRAIEFDGIFAACDHVAFGAIRGLIERGVSVPGDVSVVGYDDVPGSAYYNPPLTTVRQDVGKAGRQLVRKAMRLRNGEAVESSYLSTELVIRASCGA